MIDMLTIDIPAIAELGMRVAGSRCWRMIRNGHARVNPSSPICYDSAMTMACLCEVRRPGLATALAIRGLGVQRVGRAMIATLRPPAGGLLVAGLSAGDSSWIGLRRAWRGALMVLIEGGDQAALAAAFEGGVDDAASDRAGDALIAARIAALGLLPREYAVLLALAEGESAPVSRAALRDRVLDRSFEAGANVIEVHLSRLRAKLDRDAATPLIVTERGRGYRLAAPDQVVNA